MSSVDVVVVVVVILNALDYSLKTTSKA